MPLTPHKLLMAATYWEVTQMEVGDVVTLKSGGPLMVIEKLQGNDKAQ